MNASHSPFGETREVIRPGSLDGPRPQSGSSSIDSVAISLGDAQTPKLLRWRTYRLQTLARITSVSWTCSFRLSLQLPFAAPPASAPLATKNTVEPSAA